MGARNGAEYLARVRADNREIWLDGERIADVTRDPRLARGVHSIAALYDLQLDPCRVDQMTYPSPTSGERVGLSHIQPRSIDDLVRRRTMIRTWSE
ncbi:MAG: 4-hydroxyphenylacetate 3-monooxygenase, oxygenase component, partial [Chloroflexi bacterium]|nr:4-hydroxyphenylacetate 3-monooxygenase, oxygenase component [Chloroflexota bacterium]